MKGKSKKVMISVYDSLWEEFVGNCSAQYKSASGVIRELIIKWNGECKNGQEVPDKRGLSKKSSPKI